MKYIFKADDNLNLKLTDLVLNTVKTNKDKKKFKLCLMFWPLVSLSI